MQLLSLQKQAILKLKIDPQQLLGSLPLAFVLPDITHFYYIICVKNNVTILVNVKISCQLLALGGSMGLRYVLQLLFSEKSQNCNIHTHL
jgi:hypothetical protein